MAGESVGMNFGRTELNIRTGDNYQEQSTGDRESSSRWASYGMFAPSCGRSRSYPR
jgi:hypothetical protein